MKTLLEAELLRDKQQTLFPHVANIPLKVKHFGNRSVPGWSQVPFISLPINDVSLKEAPWDMNMHELIYSTLLFGSKTIKAKDVIMYVCLSDWHKVYIQEHSIFIFPAQRAVREQSESSQRAVREQLAISLKICYNLTCMLSCPPSPGHWAPCWTRGRQSRIQTWTCSSHFGHGRSSRGWMYQPQNISSKFNVT